MGKINKSYNLQQTFCVLLLTVFLDVCKIIRVNIIIRFDVHSSRQYPKKTLLSRLNTERAIIIVELEV